jgi:hypothetical protein
MALGEQPEDAGDDLGLALVDGPVAAHRHGGEVASLRDPKTIAL